MNTMCLHFLVLLLFCSVSSTTSLFSFQNPVVGLVACRPHQIQALTEFKNEFDTLHCDHSDPFNGVWCDNSTGAITMLRLRACLSGTLKPNSSLFTLHNLRYLNLSQNNFISSSLPYKFGNLNSFPLVRNLTKLVALDLSYNRFSGTLSPNTSLFELHHLSYLNLDFNMFSSSLPSEIGNLKKLELFCGIQEFPNILKILKNLEFIDLSTNRIKGKVPQWLWNLPRLHTTLDVGYNRLTGKLPRSLVNCSSLQFLNVEKNGIEDTFPFWLKALPNLEQSRVLTSYATIDFSGNRLEGQIPESIGVLKALIALNLSNNAFTGHIPLSFSNLGKLESLDLSRNQLSGTIPNGIASLSFLEYIDVSHNQLKGEIPQGTQITGQPRSSFEGNAGLCGFPLEKSCFGTDAPPAQQPKDEDEKNEEVLSWKAIAIGYGLGVLLGLTIAQVIASYKPECLINIMCQRKRRHR
ncbi:BnaAnng16130D [Brassica napus]|uniref:BnaAnng16130D protein n=1 Tax=Brassica napus TaxID=3708 RepID=A0A078J8F4_BRANA|nr:BnaAnng16130D [Brassica napus]